MCGMELVQNERLDNLERGQERIIERLDKLIEMFNEQEKEAVKYRERVDRHAEELEGLAHIKEVASRQEALEKKVEKQDANLIEINSERKYVKAAMGLGATALIVGIYDFIRLVTAGG